MTDIILKTKLLNFCMKQLELRYFKIKKAISNVEESLFEESKNSSGDKHETARAMAQIERESSGKQLLEIEKLFKILKRIEVDTSSEYIRLGSLVLTDQLNYFISLSIGKSTVHGVDYHSVALNSPVGLLLLGKRKGETFVVNGNPVKILDVK